MGLDDLYEFKPEEEIIEYALAAGSQKHLVDLTLGQFMNETASESPAPGGGSVSAYLGSIGTALGTMVANLSSHKRGWDDRWEEFSTWAERGKGLQWPAIWTGGLWASGHRQGGCALPDAWAA